ncbi:MAG: GntR family transcriptional regulator [Ruminococcaceae bacterium]|nr:GntR family transcriptional regulator [Oscillospiraceae bacterium]
MVSFDAFRPSGETPIYRQIILFIKRGVVSGAIADGDELPSRRMLSALLGVNPNTAQKAYRLLEDEGLIASTPGAKSLVTVTPAAIETVRQELTLHQAMEAIAAMKQMGMTRQDAVEAITSLWDMEPKEGEDA